MSKSLKADEVDTPLNDPTCEVDVTEWANGFFQFEDEREYALVQLWILIPLAELELENPEKIPLPPFAPTERGTVERWLTARWRWMRHVLRWNGVGYMVNIREERYEHLYEKCLRFLEQDLDRTMIGVAPHWPHPRRGLLNMGTWRLPTKRWSDAALP